MKSYYPIEKNPFSCFPNPLFFSTFKEIDVLVTKGAKSTFKIIAKFLTMKISTRDSCSSSN